METLASNDKANEIKVDVYLVAGRLHFWPAAAPPASSGSLSDPESSEKTIGSQPRSTVTLVLCDWLAGSWLGNWVQG